MSVLNLNNEKNEEDSEKDDDQDNKSENNNDDKSDEQEKESGQDDTQSSLDTGFDLNDQKIDELLEDSETLNESVENAPQRINLKNDDQYYKIYTTEFDEIAKAETLEDIKEIYKLRKNGQ